MDDDEFLYIQIAASLRKDINNGLYKTGDTLPSIRSLTDTWQCTIGTAQRAYKKLASEGLVSSHIGRGTKVIAIIPIQHTDSLRQANLINQSEKFLLEELTSGFSPVEVESAFKVALDRWKKVSHSQYLAGQQMLRFAGSHDPAVAWIATHFEEISPGYSFHINFSGSLTGLMALSDGKVDIAGSHLWDQETESFNIPVLHSLFPGEKLALITLAQRRIGWMFKPGNPKHFQSIKDLTNPNIRFVNRHAGSGTRVYLDALLRKNGIDPNSILGYSNQKSDHSEIALEVSEGFADVGLGLETAARNYALGFSFENLERYDLIIRESIFSSKAIQDLVAWLKNDKFHQMLANLGGYDCQNSGYVQWT